MPNLSEMATENFQIFYMKILPEIISAVEYSCFCLVVCIYFLLWLIDQIVHPNIPEIHKFVSDRWFYHFGYPYPQPITNEIKNGIYTDSVRENKSELLVQNRIVRTADGSTKNKGNSSGNISLVEKPLTADYFDLSTLKMKTKLVNKACQTSIIQPNQTNKDIANDTVQTDYKYLNKSVGAETMEKKLISRHTQAELKLLHRVRNQFPGSLYRASGFIITVHRKKYIVTRLNDSFYVINICVSSGYKNNFSSFYSEIYNSYAIKVADRKLVKYLTVKTIPDGTPVIFDAVFVPDKFVYQAQIIWLDSSLLPYSIPVPPLGSCVITEIVTNTVLYPCYVDKQYIYFNFRNAQLYLSKSVFLSNNPNISESQLFSLIQENSFWCSADIAVFASLSDGAPYADWINFRFRRMGQKNPNLPVSSDKIYIFKSSNKPSETNSHLLHIHIDIYISIEKNCLKLSTFLGRDSIEYVGIVSRIVNGELIPTSKDVIIARGNVYVSPTARLLVFLHHENLNWVNYLKDIPLKAVSTLEKLDYRNKDTSREITMKKAQFAKDFNNDIASSKTTRTGAGKPIYEKKKSTMEDSIMSHGNKNVSSASITDCKKKTTSAREISSFKQKDEKQLVSSTSLANTENAKLPPPIALTDDEIPLCTRKACHSKVSLVINPLECII